MSILRGLNLQLPSPNKVQNITFWAPNPNNILIVPATAVNQLKTTARLYRESTAKENATTIKKRLIALELDHLVKTHSVREQEILEDLKHVTELAQVLTVQQPATKTDQPSSSISSSHNEPISYSITIVPNDPSFNISKDFRKELIESLYIHRNQWLPSYGPWYTNITNVAMQRSIFPKELRGSDNFQGSTSAKLMKAIMECILTSTEDFFSDIRHLTDTNAALCILNAHYCQITKTAPPQTYDQLLENLSLKLKIFIDDLKNVEVGGTFDFSYPNLSYKESLAPPNKATAYWPQFFHNHKVYQLLKKDSL